MYYICGNEMKNNNYHTMGTFPREKWWKEAKSTPLTHKYMTTRSSGLVQALP